MSGSTPAKRGRPTKNPQPVKEGGESSTRLIIASNFAAALLPVSGGLPTEEVFSQSIKLADGLIEYYNKQ